MTKPAGPEKNLREMARRLINLFLFKARYHTSTLLALIVRAASVIAAFAVTYLLGHQLGPEATGQYALVNQTAIFLAAIGLVGLDVSVVRHFSKAMAEKLPLTLRSLVRVLATGLGMLGAVIVVLWLGGDFAWDWLFGGTVPQQLFWTLCALSLARAGGQLLAGLLRSQGHTTMSQTFAALVIPAGTAAFLILGLADDVASALWAGALVGVGSIVIGIAMMARHVGHGTNVVDIPLGPVLKSSLPLWGVGISMNLNQWYILYVAAQLFSAADVGLIRVSVQIASLLQIIGTTIFSVYSASISAAFHAQDPGKAARLARTAVRVSMAAAVPFTLAILFGGEFLLGLIGPEFVTALPLLWIMTIGNLAFVFFGPAGLVLAMSGKERANLAITVSGTAALLVCLPIAGRLWGLQGMTACMVVISILRYCAANVMVRYMLKLSIWRGKTIEASPR